MDQETHFSRYCPNCGTPVRDGPLGGFVCGTCLYVQERPGEDKRRAEDTKKRHAKFKAVQDQRRAALEEEARMKKAQPKSK